MKVLLIEDSPTLQLEISNYVENAGHSITVANDGETAVQIMELSGADLIICDIEMPGLDGYETVTIIREFLGDQWAPIIFITKRDKVEDCLAGYEVGADDYLVKPINEKILHAKMRVMERFIQMQQQLNQALNTPDEYKNFDDLTGAYRSDHFLDLAMLHWSILSRQNLPVSLVMLNIDYFEQYEEFYGEESRDICLKKVAKAICTSVHRPGDFVGRITEKEFIIMLPDTGKMGSEKVAARICQTVESLSLEHKRSRVLGVVSVSIGVASINNLKQATLDQTIATASSALEIISQDSGNDFKIIKLDSMKSIGV